LGIAFRALAFRDGMYCKCNLILKHVQCTGQMYVGMFVRCMKHLGVQLWWPAANILAAVTDGQNVTVLMLVAVF